MTPDQEKKFVERLAEAKVGKLAWPKLIRIYQEEEIDEAIKWLEAIRTIPPEELVEVESCDFAKDLTKPLTHFHEFRWKTPDGEGK